MTHVKTPCLVKKCIPPLLAIFLCVLTATTATGNASQYIYDETGRLIKVVDDLGNEAIYTYDAVGNLLSITRSATSDAVAIVDMDPWSGPAGTIVAIYGKGFSATPGNNAVLFNGAAASVISATSGVIITSVPAGATSGRVTVQSPLGLATSPKDFSISQPIAVTISPSIAYLKSGESRQFTAVVTGTSNTSVIWSVEGIEGGAPAIGTIVNGLYTAPSDVIQHDSLMISARSRADTSKIVSATLYFNIGSLASQSVSVAFVQQPASVILGPIASPAVSVSYIQQSSVVTLGPVVTPAVSVGFAAQPSSVSLGPVVSPNISVFLGPFITSISPAILSIGTSSSMTITGTGFIGTSAIVFYSNGTQDTNIVASNIQVNPDGTQLTADVAISPTEAAGVRMIQITASAGSSQGHNTNGNMVTVQ